MRANEETAESKHLKGRPASQVKDLIRDHEHLIEEYKTALEKFPKSPSLERIFHPVYRPGPSEKPTDDQQAAIDWRGHLASAMGRLRESFEDQSKEAEWLRYPLALYDVAPNFGHGFTSDYVLRELERHVRLLDRVAQSAAEAKQTAASMMEHENNVAVGGAAESAAVPPSSSTTKTNRGRKRDMEGLKNFATVLAPYGDGWKAHFDDIFRKLDEVGVPIPKKWAKHKDPAVRTWEDGHAFVGDNPGRPAVQALEYRFKEAKKYFPQSLTNSRSYRR